MRARPTADTVVQPALLWEREHGGHRLGMVNAPSEPGVTQPGGRIQPCEVLGPELLTIHRTLFQTELGISVSVQHHACGSHSRMCTVWSMCTWICVLCVVYICV